MLSNVIIVLADIMSIPNVDQEIIELLKKKMVARIVSPAGSMLAYAGPRSGVGNHPELKEGDKPLLRFYSTLVQIPEHGRAAPIIDVGWVDHGEALGGDWYHDLLRAESQPEIMPNI
ncbi:hypothetical protein EW026_g7668 [Hermanssonia centrifuga]|uniref:Uncharacterized protein n=1 Tax=Hermanssonia centrifuga TaxID=98765 RepID=A0A4S4K8V1_9APHY|nr:hypothetical protein EW026_g7668 [Hermanssonia centrifuga]